MCYVKINSLFIFYITSFEFVFKSKMESFFFCLKKKICAHQYDEVKSQNLLLEQQLQEAQKEVTTLSEFADEYKTKNLHLQSQIKAAQQEVPSLRRECSRLKSETKFRLKNETKRQVNTMAAQQKVFFC